MLDSRDNSVLKSLKELRKQEDDRVKKEQAEVQARAEAERKAKADAERKAKEDVERAKREEEERVRKIEQEKLAREREEHLRLEEAERKARIDAEAQLQRERMHLEAQVKTATKAKGLPMGVIVGIAVARLMLAEGQKKIELLMADLTKAKSDAERIAIQKQIDDVKARTHASSSSGGGTRPAATRDGKDKKESAPAVAPSFIKPRKPVTDDPLEGLKL